MRFKVEVIEPHGFCSGVSAALHRHSYGACETIVCQWFPATAPVTVNDFRGGTVTNVSNSYCYYLCATNGASNVFAFNAYGVAYVPLTDVTLPEVVFTGDVRKEVSPVPAGFAGGVEMSIDLYVAPTNVSFRGLAFMEIPSTNSVVTGYFSASEFSPIWYHDETMGAGVWYTIGADNFFFNDHPRMNDILDETWSAGVLEWAISIGWGPLGDYSATNRLSQTVVQRFDFTASGCLRVSKFRHWVEREVDGTKRRSEGVMCP